MRPFSDFYRQLPLTQLPATQEPRMTGTSGDFRSSSAHIAQRCNHDAHLVYEHHAAVGQPPHLVLGVDQQQATLRRLRLPELKQRKRCCAGLRTRTKQASFSPPQVITAEHYVISFKLAASLHRAPPAYVHTVQAAHLVPLLRRHQALPDDLRCADRHIVRRRLGRGRDDIALKAVVFAHAIRKGVAAVLPLASSVVGPQ